MGGFGSFVDRREGLAHGGASGIDHPSPINQLYTPQQRQPEPLPTPFVGLVNFLLVQTGFREPRPARGAGDREGERKGRGRGSNGSKKGGVHSNKEGDAAANDARWEAATAAAADAVEEGRVGDEEDEGGHAVAGAGDGVGVARVEFGDVKGLRSVLRLCLGCGYEWTMVPIPS